MCDNRDDQARDLYGSPQRRLKKAQSALAAIPALMSQLDYDSKHVLADILQATFEAGFQYDSPMHPRQLTQD